MKRQLYNVTIMGRSLVQGDRVVTVGTGPAVPQRIIAAVHHDFDDVRIVAHRQPVIAGQRFPDVDDVGDVVIGAVFHEVDDPLKTVDLKGGCREAAKILVQVIG